MRHTLSLDGSPRTPRDLIERRNALSLRVMFDSQIFCHQRFGGISRYISSLALAMAQLDAVEPLVVAPLHFNEYLGTLPPALVRGRKIPWLERLPGAAFAAGSIPSRIVARRFKPAILHNTYYFPEKQLREAKLVITVHDMTHEKYPNYFLSSPLISSWKRSSMARANHVICVSESTRRDLLNIFDVPESKVSVVHHGHGPLGEPAAHEAPIRHGASRGGAPYILYVGGRAAYKNFNGLLRGYASSPWLRNNFMLLCFGGGDFTRAERSALSNLQVEDRVRRVSGSDGQLADCYRQASLFVFPSECEGFGIPLLEAMALGCPVACSNSSSFPEVVGDAAKLFDASDPDAIRLALESVLNSPADAASLIDRGYGRQAQFSWSLCAEKTVQAYRKMLLE